MPAETQPRTTANGQSPTEHARSMQVLRRQVGRYLDFLAAPKPAPTFHGRRTRQYLERRLHEVQTVLATPEAEPDRVKYLLLVQERSDIAAELKARDDAEAAAQADTTGDEITADFIKAAKPWGESKGISYQSWRSLGVPSKVLKQAGIKPG